MPGSRASSGSAGRVATETSHRSDRPIPMRTPASTPTTSVLTRAAIAIQKSNRCTRNSRRRAATSIIPMTTASMMIAARTAVGRPENSGASRTSVSRTMTPVVSDATGDRAPVRSLSELADRLVDTGMPCTRPAPMFAAPCANASWLMSTR